MALADLNDKEREIVKQCLRAAAEGPFFPDWEFYTLFGLTRMKVKSVLELWPPRNENEETVQAAIAGSLNHFLGYPHGCDKEWPQFISVSPAELLRVFNKWRGDV